MNTKQISCADLNVRNCEKAVAQILSRRFDGHAGPVLIAVGGPGGTGKSSFCKRLRKQISDCAVLTLDDYKLPRKVRQESNLFGAHPDANDCALVRRHLTALRNGSPVEKPVYDSVDGTTDQTESFFPRRIVLLDGEISTYEQFRDLVDFSIFIDSDWRTQLATRLSRDIEVRRYTPEKAIRTFLQSNISEFGQFGKKSKTWADMVLFCRNDYCLAIESISETVKPLLKRCKQISPAAEMSGMVVAVPTPFDSESRVDYASFRKHLEFLREHGVNRIVVNGTTGEFFSLSLEERVSLAKAARNNWDGFLCVHVSDIGLGATMEQTRQAEDLGADAFLLLPPLYSPSTSAKAMIDYFNIIKRNCSIPCILYNHKFAHTLLTPEVLESVDHFALKDSTGDMTLINHTPRYFTGKDSLIRDSFLRGAEGFVSGYANFIPDLYCRLETALKEGNDDQSAALQSRIDRISNLLSGPGQISAIKHVLSHVIQGYPVHTRPPVAGCSAELAGEMALLVENLSSETE
ncbi:MAG: dihydrodipicolinate synthase family protein [Chitinispirillaceae bacterium]